MRPATALAAALVVLLTGALGPGGAWGADAAASAAPKPPSKAAARPKAPPPPPPPELPAETLSSNSSLAAATQERIYVADVAIAHIADGRLRVFDARAGKLLGLVNTGFAGNFVLSPKSDRIYVATTYLSRGGRGTRTDVLEVWNSDTLALEYEVVLPPKRAQALNYRGLVSVTADGRFVLVQNATPATSITIVDTVERKLAGEVQTPGCWGTLPAAGHAARFSMLCGDGKLATVTLDDKGQVAERQLSEKLFDADLDAWFHTAERIGDRAFFVSFQGVIHEVDVGGASARAVGSRPVVSEAQRKQGWRPGGYQAFAVHPDGRHAVLAMHDKGGEGSHKLPARQLWTVDLQTGKRVATAPGQNVVSIAFSRNGRRLQALDGVGAALLVWDWGGPGKLTAVSSVKPAGMASLHLETHD